jgi:tetratricopeptide (TPR) repeat protein
MPSFSNMTYQDSLLKALGGIDSFDVSGMGLPIGSLLSSIVNWFDMGRTRIYGHVRKVGIEIEIVVRLEEGRDGRCGKLWRVSKPVSDGGDNSETLQEIIEELAYHILMDTTPGGWGTSSPVALRSYTNGILEIRKFYTSDSRDLNALRNAHKLFDLALRDDPIYSYAAYNLGIVELNLGNYEDAINHFKELKQLEIQPYKAEIYYNMGIAYYYRTLDWAYDVAENAFSEVLKCYPRYPKKVYDRQLLSLTYSGLILINAQKSRLEPPDFGELYSSSLKHFEKAKALAAGDNTITAQALYSLAVLYQNRRSWDEAEIYIQEALALNPYHWRAYTTYGQISLARKDHKKAISVLRKAINLSPNYEYAHYLLGQAYTMDDQTMKAIESYAKAPNIARAHNEWGRILALRSEYDKAVGKFEQAAAMNSQFSDAFGNIAWYLAEGGMLEGQGFQRAVEAARREIELCKKSPREWHGYAVLGHVYYYHQDLNASREALNTAKQLNRYSTQVYYYLAMIDFDEGEYQSARENLIKLFQLKIKDDWHNKAATMMNEIKRKLEDN